MCNSFVTPWTVALHAPLSMGFPSQGYWSGLSFSIPGALTNPRIETVSPVLAGRFFTTNPPGNKASKMYSIERSSIQSAKTRPGADCGSDHELFIANFRLKLKKVGKTTRPFRYDLTQIPYDSTVEVRNRFKGLDLIECLMNYGMRFMSLYRRQGSRPSPWKRNAKKQNGCLRRPYI